MKLSDEKLQEVEYYEQHVEQGHNRGYPYIKDVIILHYGEYEKEYKLFGIPIWHETIPDRSERYEFERLREPTGEEDLYEFKKSKGFKKIIKQLEAFFENDFAKVYEELKNNEIGYIVN